MIEHAPVGLPEDLAYAGFRAFGLYPQGATGTNLLGGEVLIHDVLNGNINWKDVPHITPSDKQVEAYLDGAKGFHQTYKSLCRPGDVKDVRNHVFTRERVAALTIGWVRSGVPEVAARFAHAVLPDETPSMLPLARTGTVQERNYEASSVLLAPSKNGEFCPEALALGGLWAAGADVLRSKPALAVAKGYRGVLSEMYGDDVTLAEWHDYRSELFTAGDKLRELVREGVNAALPAIEEQTGYTVPVAAANVFVNRSTTSIKTTAPARIRLLMQADLEAPK